MLTRGLFKEYSKDGTESLDQWRETFVNTLDPTEYKGAIALLGSWADWRQFKHEWPFFAKRILPSWIEEIEIALRSKAIKSLTHNAIEENDSSAAKWIAEKRWKPNEKGRPTKAQIEREARIAARIDEQVDDDVQRVLEVIERDT